MLLIDKFNFDEKDYFTNLLKGDPSASNINQILNDMEKEGNNFAVMDIEYYKDDKGNLYKHTYFNSEKINFNDLSGYYKQYVHEFETEAGVIFVTI